MLSSHLLQEHLNIHGKLGCLLSILGSTIIIIHAPEESVIENVLQIGRNMLSFGFVLYSFLAISLSIYLIFWVAPVHGQTNILVYIAICSSIGSLTVVGCKGLSIAIKLTVQGKSQLMNPLAWFFLIAVIVCITIQMNYLNKSLDIFNTSLVTPIYYVMFTSLTITASAILFKEFGQLTTKNIIGSLCGFAVIICGVFLLHAFKDINFTLSDLLALTNRPANGNHEQDPQNVTIILDGNGQIHSPPVRNRIEVDQTRNESYPSEENNEEEVITSETDRFIPLPRTSQ